MKADLPQNIVQQVAIAAVLDSEEGKQDQWQIYLLNEHPVQIQNVLVRSSGYGSKDGLEIKTSVLRHFIGDVQAKDYARIEPIDEQVFGIHNEYWVSFYLEGVLYDKKFVFTPNSIQIDLAVPIDVVSSRGIRLD